MNRREAHAQGKVWATLSFSGGTKNPPPLLGPTSIKATGAKDDDTAFRIYVLFTGAAKTGAEADMLLAEAKLPPAKKKAKRKKKGAKS